MTPSQLEHLKLIDAHLERLLAIAEKRTPGMWSEPHLSRGDVKCDCTYVLSGCYAGSICDIQVDNEKSISDGGNDSPPIEEARANGSFISSCAGNAEAGWSQLREEIADLIAFNTNCRGWKDDNGCAGAAIQYIQLRMAKILTAFPLELIQKS